MDFAVVLDVGLPSYAATYNLEGDDFLAPLVMDELLKLESYRSHWSYAHPQTHPKVRQVAHARYPISPSFGNPDPQLQVRKQWIETTLLKGTLAWNYFYDTIMKRDAEMEPERMHFEGAHLWHPAVARMQGREFDIRPYLAKIHFLKEDEQRISDIAGEWVTYRALLDPIRPSRQMSGEDLRTFWEAHKEALPHMFACAQDLLLGQPSSATAERVFSILAQTFTKQQFSTLQDLIELQIMMRYHDRQRKKYL